MFTGLVQTTGRVDRSSLEGTILTLGVHATELADELDIGDSVAVSGVCLTATRVEQDRFEAELAEETRRRSTLGLVDVDSRVNLELPLRPGDRLGGHFVQGHVDEVGEVEHAGPRDENFVLKVRHSSDFDRLVVEKGSITIDGVSLTVTACEPGWLEVMLIPHTLEITTFSALRPGARVNLEYDILAKHVARLAEPYGLGGSAPLSKKRDG